MYKCIVCGRKFINLNALTRHLWRYHDDEPIICPACGYRAIDLQGLEYHSSARKDDYHQAIYLLLHRHSRNVTKIPVLKSLKAYFAVSDE